LRGFGDRQSKSPRSTRRREENRAIHACERINCASLQARFAAEGRGYASGGHSGRRTLTTALSARALQLCPDMNTCVLVVDPAKARFFLVEPPEDLPITAHLSLSEAERLTDDARAPQKARFMARVADEVRGFTEREAVTKFVLAAEPRLLGELREPVTKALPPGIEHVDVAEDLSWQTPDQILKALIRHSAL
jgi:protein required for attachment to host cells